MTMQRITIVLALLLGLCSCSLLGPQKVPVVHHFTLTRTSDVKAKRPLHRQTLLVSRPIASPGYDSTAMIYVRRPYHLQSFSRSDWVATPAQMITPLLAQSLLNSHRYQAVVTPPYSGHSDYRLESQLLALRQEFTHKPSRVRMVMAVQLLQNNSGRVITSARFVTSAKCRHDTAYSGVLASNHALKEMLEKITRFVSSSTPSN